MRRQYYLSEISDIGLKEEEKKINSDVNLTELTSEGQFWLKFDIDVNLAGIPKLIEVTATLSAVFIRRTVGRPPHPPTPPNLHNRVRLYRLHLK